MKITFDVPSTEAITIDIDPEDIPLLGDLSKICLADRVRIVSLANPLLPYETRLVELCAKYGVDHHSKASVSNFIRAALGVSSEDLSY